VAGQLTLTFPVKPPAGVTVIADVPLAPAATVAAVPLTVKVPLLVTVKATPLLATPPTVTKTLPVVAPLGTGTTMLVALQLVGVPAVPLNVTVLVVAPKFVPVIMTAVPTAPEVGLKLVIAGPGAIPFSVKLKFKAPPSATGFGSGGPNDPTMMKYVVPAVTGTFVSSDWMTTPETMSSLHALPTNVRAPWDPVKIASVVS
jgi:hypothetical protein